MKGVLESLIRGLGTGSVYALLALGFVIIYKATRVISFAQPALMIAGAVAVSYLVQVTGFYVAVLLSTLLIAGVALVVERVAIRPMVGRPVFVVAIITLGVDVVIRVVVNGFIGLDVRQVGDPWGLRLADIGGLAVQQRWIAMFLTTAVLVGLLFAFFRYTRYGLAMRAAAFDQETALAQGVSVGMVFALSWGLAGGLAAVAGTFVGTGQGVDQLTWIIALKALPAIIVGGLDSLGGAVIGGLVIGVVESLVQSYQGDLAPWLGQNFAVVTPYVVMLLVLLVRPYGLFGTPEVERV
ncbi:branched-chain amino acid ABC transporter permease [Planobispora takensis]|uniref:Branched-chain amino acid ABC transporter permease n=1 Tax=Planobispora takensis TaxID=1367882 RepID=A0A8J3SS26_9ACTN|nr:branched-chain amino acid ABC transporter permease [Planobispora takensis]